MRVVADISTAGILQVEKSPVIGDSRPFNGRFALPIPEMVAVDIDSSSYVLPVDGGDVFSQAMASLLVQYPMYENVVFNPLLTAADQADLDLTASFPGAPAQVTRALVGRGTGLLPLGAVPDVTACLLPQNGHVVPARPGILITDTVDITIPTGGLGADEFMLWWKLFDFDTSEDVTSDFGATAGQNDPAVRSVLEVDQEPSGFEVHISHDDGVTYTQVDRLTPTDLGSYGTLLRVAFKNTSTTNRRYVAAFAILF